MSRSLPALLALVAALALPAAAAADHDTPYQFGEKDSPTFSPAMKNLVPSKLVDGPCTDTARKAMPAAPGHDHLDVAQHNFKCRASKVFFDPWTDVFAPRPDLVTGEMNVKGNLMVVGVAYPESGFVLYDITNPAKPQFLSWYRGEECDQTLGDADCGGYVDLSNDLRRVYLSTQISTVLTNPSVQTRPPATPGLDVIDITIPTLPVRIQKMPEVGNHTTRSFVVPATGGAGPREPGEYAVSISTPGLALNLVTPAGAVSPLPPIELAEAHDTFIQDDPILGRTLMYVAAGFDTGFHVFDMTAPSAPVHLAEWDLTPECGADWYSHTIDVTTRDGKRYVTMPTEAFDFFGSQGEEAELCGEFQGNGDYAAPMWIVDATDLSKLGPKALTDNSAESAEAKAQLKDASEKALVATWANPARRAAGELTFSPHNQQIVGDKIYLSQYHGGVTVLDASEAFKGRNVRPHEVAYYVPHDAPTRPIHPDAGTTHFTTGFIDYRPLIWDITYANGSIFVPDMTGGLTVVREDDAPPVLPISAPGPISGCADRTAPRTKVTRVKVTRRKITLRGSASDRACGGKVPVANVAVSIARQVGRKCSFLSAAGKLVKARSCSKPIFLAARGTERWSYSRSTKLPRGRYRVIARATDGAGNREKPASKRARVR